MDIGVWFWVAIAAAVVLVVFVFRKTGFRIGAEGFGAKVELEGKGGDQRGGAASPTAASEVSREPVTVEARNRSIAIGRDAKGTFVAGDGNRVSGRRED